LVPVLFNTIVERNLLPSKFSPWAGASRSPAVFIFNYNNDIFVQLKRGESLGRVIGLEMRSFARLGGRYME